nr:MULTISPECIES: hypothetical protein [Emticicia]
MKESIHQLVLVINAIYRKPNTSKPNKEYEIYPYLLRGLKIIRPNQVWATDITYIPMAKDAVLPEWFRFTEGFKGIL